jgi:hypothetical protein
MRHAGVVEHHSASLRSIFCLCVLLFAIFDCPFELLDEGKQRIVLGVDRTRGKTKSAHGTGFETDIAILAVAVATGSDMRMQIGREVEPADWASFFLYVH